ncbi:hypothetical protein P9443_08115 [Peribacillus frigoritolerans]|uniref:hypothetical protein n=1 Tax=Peribacillus TaxID=2675229 RepID=UPI002552956C|nr:MULTISPECIES: hypothetical protein [Peribacillus]MED4632878.1 hypothetical protein [Peribacillus frigoritolerans]
MKDIKTQFVITQEQNELGTMWIERLIEKLLFQEIGFSVTEQIQIINKRYQGKEDKIE